MKKFLLVNKTIQKILLPGVVVSSLLLTGCATAPPKNAENICQIFYEKDDWYDAAQDSWERWGVPIHVPMAMMYQESSFKSDALPPKDYVFFGMGITCQVGSRWGSR